MELLQQYTFQIVALGTVMLGLVCGVIGTFAVLRQESLLGDGLAHSTLPGVVGAFLLTGVKDTAMLLLGAIIAACVAEYIMYRTSQKGVRFDAALATILAAFFGFGTVLLTRVQSMENAGQAGLNTFIFGQAVTMMQSDIWLMAICGTCIVGGVILLWKELSLTVFDPVEAQLMGIPVRKVRFFYRVALIVTIVIGIRTVGVILISSLLIGPTMIGRQWTHSLRTLVIIGAISGSMVAFLGTWISALWGNLPTGPMIIIVMTGMIMLSLVLANGQRLVRGWMR